jgi:hypothetical protein
LKAGASTSSLPQIQEMLKTAGRLELQNDKLVQGLLRSPDRHGSGLELDVTVKNLGPRWDSARSLSSDLKPRRILFGSTGRAGDDRTLPLDFDFGSGAFSFAASMSASNTLALDPGLVKGTDASSEWLRTHHTGFHYWAGVYNNQNTYIAPWFRESIKGNDDVWMRLADGKALRSDSGDWGQVNIWNPLIRNYVRDYCATQGRSFAGNPYLVCYDYTAEPHPFASQPPGQYQYSGYNQSAIEAFHGYLKKKFGSIRNLNHAWRTNYSAFAGIEPPPDEYISRSKHATPLSYEFQLFRAESHAAFWKAAADGYRSGDRKKPIVANAGMYMSGWPVEALEPYMLMQSNVCDWVDMHMNNFWPNLPEQIYLYSLCRLTGKTPVQFEYVWTFPRTAAFDDKNENDFRATCEASVWRNLAWGKKAMVFFDWYYDWPAYHNAFFDRDAEYGILRPSACVVPTTKRKALRYNDILMNTEVSNPPIVIIEPNASIRNSPPVHPNQGFSYHTTIAGKKVHDLLFPKNYPFLYVPEQAVLDGYALSQHKVVILPEAPYLPEEMTARLIKWVKSGGLLVCLGPAGAWTPYGFEDGRLMSEAFGKSSVSDTGTGTWDWRWVMESKSKNILWQTNSQTGDLIAALARLGKGRVLMSASTFDEPALQQKLFEILDRAMGAREVSSEKNAFELVVREDKRGHKYLFVLNADTRAIREDTIRLGGKVSCCVDLGIGSGVPVPLVKGDPGMTTFKLRLHPGEGTVVAVENIQISSSNIH